MSIKRTYKCHFCGKSFARETWFKKHMCEKKARFMESHNISTIRAHRLFNHWQRRSGILRKGKEKSMEDFCKSPLFITFKRLEEFANERALFSAFKYVDWIVENAIPEKKWYEPETVAEFEAFMRDTTSPARQARSTLRYIRLYCMEKDMNPNSFFDEISVSKAMSMIQANQISPWVLFGYEPAVVGLLDRFQGEMLYRLDEHLNIPYWLERVRNEPEASQEVVDIMEGRDEQD